MISADCEAIRDGLDAFVDGELRGTELLRVSNHLDGCRQCADEVANRRRLGGLIRETVEDTYQTAVPSGLAAGVVARASAELYFSWRSVIGRGVEDWHWFLVGGGAVSAAFLSMLFCGALLLFGTSAQDADSLSALGSSLRNSRGDLYAEVSRQGGDPDVMLVQLDTGGEASTGFPAVLNRSGEERSLVDALGETLVKGGRLVQLTSMPEAERRYTEWLLDNIARLRNAGSGVGPLSSLRVYRLHLVTNAEVTAKGLD